MGNKNPRGEKSVEDEGLTLRKTFDDGRLAEITWRDADKPAMASANPENVNRDAKGDKMPRGRPPSMVPRESEDRNKQRGRY